MSRATEIFDDEFDETSLNDVWSTCYPWANPKKGCTNGGNLELEWYLPGNVSLSVGHLDLTAKPQTAYARHGHVAGVLARAGQSYLAPEIDIIEWQGVTPKNDIVTIHWGSPKQPRVVWYFDGKPVKTYTASAPPEAKEFSCDYVGRLRSRLGSEAARRGGALGAAPPP